MRTSKLFVVLMTLAVVATLLPLTAWADGEPGTRAEEAAYAQREAASPEAAEFVGGDALGIVLVILLIAGIIILLWIILEHHHHS